MKKIVTLITLFSILTSCKKEIEWTPLLDNEFSQWDTYLSYQLKNGYDGSQPKDSLGNLIAPIGVNKPNNVFSVIQENDQPILKITGETYGCVFTKQSYENYHLKLQFKWGEKKWEPRLQKPKDSGILYHSFGEMGAEWWRAWMFSQEFQIMETSLGDYWNQMVTAVDIKAHQPQNRETYIADATKDFIPFGKNEKTDYCARSKDYEIPNQWNTLELITFGDKSLHIVNGKVVMVLKNSRYIDTEGKTIPLTKGKIQLQSEAAEVFYKDIKIRSIKELPKDYALLYK